MKRYFSFLILVIFLVGCGYRPSTSYVKDIFATKVYIDLKVDIKNSKNSAYLKDKLTELLITKFDSQIVKTPAKANIIINLKLKKISQRTLQTDNNGYVKIYRTKAIVMLKYKKHYEKKWHKVKLEDYDDYLVDADSLVTQYNKEKSIENVITKVVYSLVSKLAIIQK